MDPWLLLRWPLYWSRLWLRVLGRRLFWALFALSTLVVIGLILSGR